MLPLTEITQQTPSPKLTQEFIEKILNNASARDLIEIVKYFKDENAQDSESPAGADSLKLSSKTAEELTGFFNKIAKNLELFYRDCQPGHFPTSFTDDIKSATKRLKSGSDLRPEQRLELQPSAYSGFDDNFSQQNFANILFVMAMANYASNKSQGKIEEDKFIAALKSMDDQSAKQLEELSREPRFQTVIPYTKLFFGLAYILNVATISSQASSFVMIRGKMNQKINHAIGTRKYFERSNDYNTNAILSKKNFTDAEIEIIRHNQTDLLARDFDKYNVSQTDIDGMIKNRNEKMIVPILGIAESSSRIIADSFFGFNGLHNDNTKFLLFMTSLLFASEAIAENISYKNLFKTFLNIDEPTSVDNRLLVDAVRTGLFIASQFDSRFRIDRIANNIINSFSSLAIGVVNYVKSLSKSREVQDLESGEPLMENTIISPDQIQELAKEFTRLLAISTPTPELRASSSTPTTEVRVSSSASAGGTQPTTLIT